MNGRERVIAAVTRWPADRVAVGAMGIDEQTAQAVRRFNSEWCAGARQPIAIHIGVSTGPAAAGNIGSRHFLQYATIGDATNLASRICDVAQPGEIAIGVPTLERLGGRVDWPIEGPEYHSVKGRAEPLPIYKLRYS